MVHLLTDQMEFADVVILNKVADATDAQVDAAHKIVRSLNAGGDYEITIRRLQRENSGRRFDFDKA